MDRKLAQRNIPQEVENKRKKRAEFIKKSLEKLKGKSSEIKATTSQELDEVKGMLPKEAMAEVVQETGIKGELNEVATAAQTLIEDFETKAQKIEAGEDTTETSQETTAQDSFEIQAKKEEEDYLKIKNSKVPGIAKKEAQKKAREKGITDPAEIAKIEEEERKKAQKTVVDLESRYEKKETSAAYVLDQMKAYAKASGVEYQSLEESEQNLPFGPETKAIILERVKQQIEKLFKSKDKEVGRFSEKKYESVVKEVERYADLLIQVQQEEGRTINSETVFQKLQEIIVVLAYQDESASENLLGDHGIRHLIDHNVVVSETIMDQIQEKGGKVRAIDRVMLHEVMIYHDLGYAMDPVRKPINEDGIKGQDFGHNLLASKFARERRQVEGDSSTELFTNEEADLIHQGILNHDSNQVSISFEDTPEARRNNFESAIHIADNTHAFEDKLPEILYSIPESLRTMYLMRIAADVEDKDSINTLRNLLIQAIQSNESLTTADKKGLVKAAQGITSDSFKFSVGRICGNKPQISIDEKGKVQISVTESEIHRQAVGVFDMKAYDQLKKFIKDLTGVEEEITGDQDIDTDKIAFKIVSAGKQGAEQNKSDYQQNIENLITDPAFQTFRAEVTNLQSKVEGAKAINDKESVTLLQEQIKNLIKEYSSQL